MRPGEAICAADVLAEIRWPCPVSIQPEAVPGGDWVVRVLCVNPSGGADVYTFRRPPSGLDIDDCREWASMVSGDDPAELPPRWLTRTLARIAACRPSDPGARSLASELAVAIERDAIPEPEVTGDGCAVTMTWRSGSAELAIDMLDRDRLSVRYFHPCKIPLNRTYSVRAGRRLAWDAVRSAVGRTFPERRHEG